MKFGYILRARDDWNELSVLARHAAATGWDSVWFPDHLMFPGVWLPGSEQYVAEPWQEGWTSLAALAALVPRVRLGHIVTCNTLRHPALLAKMAATVDRLSGGRLILGLGAGYLESEHTAYGIPFYTQHERLLRLDEACRVIRSLFSEDRTTFSGRFYRINDAPFAPKPLQQPLPLLLAATGEKIALRVVARHADIWNMPGLPEVIAPKLAVLDRHCRDIGRDPAEIERTALANVILTEDPGAESTRWPAEWTITGTPREVREVLRRYGDLGIDQVMVRDTTSGSTIESRQAELDRFLNEVAADLRSPGSA